MPANFCPKCGQRLHPPARFCDNCGEPIHSTPEVQNAPPAVNVPASADARNRLRGPGIRDETETQEDTPWGIPMLDLNDLIGLSFMGAPLDTDMLLVEDENEGRVQYMPLAMISDLQDLNVNFAATVEYCFADLKSEYKYALDYIRNDVASDVADAFLEMMDTSILRIIIYLHFKPREFGPEAARYTGKWATCVRKKDGLNDVRLLTQLSLSGWMLKRRMEEHEIWLSDMVAGAADDEERKLWNEVLTSSRTAREEMPDDFVRAAYCIGSVLWNGEEESTVLSDEDLARAANSPIRARGPKTAGRRAGLKDALIGGGQTPRVADMVKTAGIYPFSSVRRCGASRTNRDLDLPPHARPKRR